MAAVHFLSHDLEFIHNLVDMIDCPDRSYLMYALRQPIFQMEKNIQHAQVIILLKASVLLH